MKMTDEQRWVTYNDDFFEVVNRLNRVDFSNPYHVYIQKRDKLHEEQELKEKTSFTKPIKVVYFKQYE